MAIQSDKSVSRNVSKGFSKKRSHFCFTRATLGGNYVLKFQLWPSKLCVDSRSRVIIIAKSFENQKYASSSFYMSDIGTRNQRLTPCSESWWRFEFDHQNWFSTPKCMFRVIILQNYVHKWNATFNVCLYFCGMILHFVHFRVITQFKGQKRNVHAKLAPGLLVEGISTFLQIECLIWHPEWVAMNRVNL